MSTSAVKIQLAAFTASGPKCAVVSEEEMEEEEEEEFKLFYLFNVQSKRAVSCLHLPCHLNDNYI